MSDVVTLRGPEGEVYIRDIVTSVSKLSKRLEDSSFFSFQELTDFAKTYKWDLTRLPPVDVTANVIKQQLQRVAQTYAQFLPVRDAKNPLDNKEYFDEVTLATASGFPYYGMLSDLELAVTDKKPRLERIPEYEATVRNLTAALEGDEYGAEETMTLVQQAARDARRRNFTETLDPNTLFGSSKATQGRSLIVNKVIEQGVDTLYNISVISYSKASGLIHIYEVDAWQDTNARGKTQHISDGEKPAISDAFMSMFNYADDNRSWFVLGEIDDKLEGIHPVHVSRFTVGPFDSPYRISSKEKPFFGSTAAILQADPHANILQAQREYTYAPNTEVRNGEVRQRVDRNSWYDTFLVCPKKYAAEFNGNIKGTRLFVLEK